VPHTTEKLAQVTDLLFIISFDKFFILSFPFRSLGFIWSFLLHISMRGIKINKKINPFFNRMSSFGTYILILLEFKLKQHLHTNEKLYLLQNKFILKTTKKTVKSQII